MKGKGVRGVALERERVEVDIGQFWERMRSVSADIEVSSAKNELCDCKTKICFKKGSSI